MNNSNCHGCSKLIHLQLHATWYDSVPGCVVLDSRSCELNLIVTLITDLGLLLTMLVGLLRVRRDGGGTIGVGNLLLKQVGS
jgi:hypothetical protein